MNSNIYFLIELTARKIRRYGQEVLRSHGIDITIEQWLVLKVISENEPTNQIFIGEQLIKDKPTISRMVNQLEKKELIKKTAWSSDLRHTHLSMSKKGKALIRDLYPIIEQIRLKGLSKLTEEESRSIEDILEKIQNNIRE